jgi:hypothetical protein
VLRLCHGGEAWNVTTTYLACVVGGEQMARVGCVVHRLLTHSNQPRLTAHFPRSHGLGVLVALLLPAGVQGGVCARMNVRVCVHERACVRA